MPTIGVLRARTGRTSFSRMDSSPGALAGLSARYRFERELGRGGMATVYLARDLQYDRPVAIKVLRPEFASAADADRFLREIRIVGRLDHPNILPLLDSGLEDDSLWYAMPAVADESLRQRLDRVGGQLALDEVIAVGRQVAEALDHAHAAGIVHRDIKPENILLCGERAWVADFGIARIVAGPDDLPRTSGTMVIGTPAYMSPEQARGGEAPLDGRSDIYSLGCVLYEMVGGAPPFTGGQREAILARHALDPVPPLRTVRRTAGTAADAAFQEILAKSPADRPGTAVAAVELLQVALARGDAPRYRGLKLAAAAAIVVAAAVLARSLSADRMDDHRVVVLPFEIQGTAQLSGEDVATALADVLNTTDSLVATVAAVADSSGRLPWADSLVEHAARTRRARWAVTGRTMPGAGPTVQLQLHDVANGSRLPREAAMGSPGDVFTVARSVARSLLPDLIRPGAPVDERLLSRDVPAVAFYLQGERAYRRGQYQAADSLFGSAVARDSGFAWAALRGAQAANWLTERSRASRFVEVALRKVDSLPPRYAAFARGLAAYGRGQADSAVAYYDRALALDHRWAEAHLALGEVYEHYLPDEGYPLAAAAAAFDSALMYDPGFVAPLFHATQHAIWSNLPARADSLMRRFAAVTSDTAAEWRQLVLMRSCLSPEPNGAQWADAARRWPAAATQAATWLTSAGVQHPACAISGLSAIIADTAAAFTWRFYAAMELASLQAARHDTAAFRHLVPLLGPATDVMTIFLATSGLPIQDLADSALARIRHRANAAPGSLDLWAAGTWFFERGDTVAAMPFVQALAARAAGATDTRRARLLHASLRARVELARTDTSAAIAWLERVRPNADQATLRWNPWEAMPWERLQLARLLDARGQSRRAAEVAAAFDSPASFGFAPWLPASLAFRERVERSLGDATYARALHQRYERLTAFDPSP